jgi:hypothetical protein
MYTAKKKKKKKKKRICDFNNHHILSSNSCKKTKIVDVKIMKSKAINEVTRDESKVVGISQFTHKVI